MAEISDRELVLELCRRLGLTRVPRDQMWLGGNQFDEQPNEIVIGEGGEGYCGFYCAFSFDGDKLTGHSCLE